jgi:diguanylate cyclase (GGDEF)-like protein
MGSDANALNVLLIEDSLADARIFEIMLTESLSTQFHVDRVGRLSDGLERLKKGVDLIVLDLSLPDSQGLDALVRLSADYGRVPIVVLTGLEDDSMGLEALKKGAQDYLVKGNLERDFLPKTLRYAVERHRIQSAIKELAVLDELTGLQNRRGFQHLVEQEIKLAFRNKTYCLLYFMDLNNFKLINDRLGHKRGDEVLLDAARVLKATFRESDVITRFGGDEFAVFAMDVTAEFTEIIRENLAKGLLQISTDRELPFELSFSIGISEYDPASPTTLDEILESADRQMYRDKASKKTKV